MAPPRGIPRNPLDKKTLFGKATKTTQNQLIALPGVTKRPTPTQDKKLRENEDPMALRAAVVATLVPAAAEDIKIVQQVLRAERATQFLRYRPTLAGGILHEVYDRAGSITIDEKSLRSAAQDVLEEATPLLYENKIREVLTAAGVNVPADVAPIREAMQSAGIGFSSTRFERFVFEAKTQVKTESSFDRLFTKAPAGQDSIKTEMGDALSAARRRQAIRVLKRFGLDASTATDDDWARAALLLSGSNGVGRERNGGVFANLLPGEPSGDLELPFPDFETAEVLGLIPENISTCGDLYYIHIFGKLGTFRAVDALALRFFDRLNLGLGDTARLLYGYIKERQVRFSHEDRENFLDRLFEGGEDGHGTFKLLMGQMVEGLIEFNNARNAGELLVGTGATLPSSTRRSAVLRSIENLQRYLSRSGGGMALFMARESGTQLMDCFEILRSQELRTYFGGEFTEGMFSIIEELVEEADGRPGPPADRMRTLAVHGRKIIRFLADTANDVTMLTDEDLDELSEHVHNWLAAYRRPAIEGPEWLDDDHEVDEDGGPGADAIRDALDDAELDSEPDVLAGVTG